MKKISTYRLTLLLLVFGMACSMAEAKNKKQDFPLRISFINQSWAFPGDHVFRMRPFYPGAVVGTELYYRKGEKGCLYQSVNLGFFINRVNGSAAFLVTESGYRYTTGSGFYADISLGLGYLHFFYPRTTFRQNDQDEYVKVPNIGKPTMLISNGLSLGYDLTKKAGKPLAFFFKYQWMAQYPYFQLIPIRPNGLLHVGITYYWKS